ncbi:MAG: DUF2178 domain-containing protein [Halanaerobiales bacterium]|nr:DUF2178 domain-containing protein [Halanaerobiales bacterium]
MKKKTYETIGKIFPIIVGLGVVVGIFMDSFIVPLIIIGIGVPFIMWSKTRVKEVIEDERDQVIGSKALRRSVVTFSLLATFIGLILYIQGGEMKMALSHTLLGSVSFILILYIIFFAYLERKM